MFVLGFLIDELEMTITGQHFSGYFHSVIRNMAEDEEPDEDAVEANRQIVRYLSKAAGKETIDAMEKMTGNTVLHLVCELFTDLQMVSALISQGAELNPVRNDDMMPLAIINKKYADNPDSDVLYDIKELMERKGARSSWRSFQ